MLLLLNSEEKLVLLDEPISLFMLTRPGARQSTFKFISLHLLLYFHLWLFVNLEMYVILTAEFVYFYLVMLASCQSCCRLWTSYITAHLKLKQSFQKPSRSVPRLVCSPDKLWVRLLFVCSLCAFDARGRLFDRDMTASHGCVSERLSTAPDCCEMLRESSLFPFQSEARATSITADREIERWRWRGAGREGMTGEWVILILKGSFFGVFLNTHQVTLERKMQEGEDMMFLCRLLVDISWPS